MISKTEQVQIRQLLQTPQWLTAEKLANEIIEQLKEEPSIAETQWKSLQKVLGKEGEMRGIRRFIQELYNQAQQT